MKPIGTFLVLATTAAVIVGCSAHDTYYARTSPRPATVSYPATYYDPPNYQRSNVYSSRWDYYRNYQGIHGGPERTGP